MSSTKPRKFHSRKAHKKSHLGCKTCKRRRIKCDERLPSCSQCSRIDSPCPYLDMTPQELTFFREAKVKSDATSFINMRSMNPTTQVPMQGYGYPAPPPAPMQQPMMPMGYVPPPQMPLQHMPPMQPYYPYQVPMYQGPHPGQQHPGHPVPQGHLQPPPQPQGLQPPHTQGPPQTPLHPQHSPHSQHHSPHQTHVPHQTPPGVHPTPPGPHHSPPGPHSFPGALPGALPGLSGVKNGTLPPLEKAEDKEAVSLPPLSSLPPISALTDTSNDSFQLPPIIQTQNPKHSTLPQKFGTSNTASIVKQGFETDMMRHAYGAWISDSIKNAEDHPVLYHSLLAFSHGYLYLKSHSKVSEDKGMTPEQTRDLASHHRSKALSMIHTYTDNLGESSEQLPNASDALLVTTLILAWDIFLQEDDIKPYIELSKGLAAVLQSLSLNTSQSPTTFCMAESLFQSIKSIHIPPYESGFWPEFVHKFGGIKSQLSDPTLLLQYSEIEQFFSQVSSLLQNEPRNFSNPTSYPPQTLYQFLRQWLTIFPSRALSGFTTWKTHDEKLLFSYCHAASRALDALFPEVRFLFQIGFIGPVDLVGLDNSLEESLNTSTELTYPLRIVGFFKMRTSLASRILFDDDPFEGSPSLVERKKSRFAMLKEIFVSSFEHPTVPQFDHYKSNGTNEGESPDSVSASSVTGGSSSPRTSVTSISGDEGMAVAASNAVPAAAGASSWKQTAFARYFVDRMEILGN
ncbi:Sterol uptake control protein 2 [Yarrowia sp. B02]|nr:Sterol uptake control protein 2 [Yarrowia sp. B02]